ncbi:MAG: hypothetical protein S4CHLAM102_16300 [Chlamydiia bacterium]|nr:hypothetical protein [Chlamydiia bacterium]
MSVLEACVCNLPPENEELNVTDLFDIALQNSPVTAESWAMAKASASSYAMARSLYYPDLQFEGSYEKIRNGAIYDGVLFINEENAYGPMFSLTWLLLDCGERQATVNKHLQTLHESNWSHNESIQEVLKTVADAYYAYLYEKANLVAFQEDLTDALEAYTSAQKKLEFGVADIAEMLQAKTYYLQRKVMLTQQEARVKNSYVYLLNELGLPGDTQLAIADFPDQAPVEEFTTAADDLLELAKVMRPDINAGRSKVLAAQAELDRANSAGWFTLDTTLELGETWYNNGKKTTKDYLVQFDLTLPLFRGFYYNNQIKEAKASLEDAKSELKRLELSAIEGVLTNYHLFEAAKVEIVLTKEYKESAYEEFKSVFANYNAGTTTIVALLNSSAAFADARARYIEAKKALFSSIMNLAFSTGTLTQNAPSEKQEDGKTNAQERKRYDILYNEKN